MNSMMGVPFFEKVNPTIILVSSIVIIGYYILFSSLGTSQVNVSQTSNIISLELILWSIFILLLLLNGMSYLFNVDLTTSIKNIFSNKPTITVKMNNKLDVLPEIIKKKEVFHIPGNVYGYQDAKAICKGYNSRLATYNELSETFDKGGEWCSYGWSDGQMALFPTQESTWKKLQNIDGHEHDCGRPGINGGYIDNPNVHFGANCYGFKPDMKKKDFENMSKKTVHDKSTTRTPFEKKVEHWKNEIPNILVAPFNNNEWNSS